MFLYRCELQPLTPYSFSTQWTAVVCMAATVGGCGPVHTLTDLLRCTGVMECPPPRPEHKQTGCKSKSSRADWALGPRRLLTKQLLYPVLSGLSLSQPQDEEQGDSPHMREDKPRKKALRGLPSWSAPPASSITGNSGSRREKHILHLNLFMVPEGPLSPDEGPFYTPAPLCLLIDMWNPSLRDALKAVSVCIWKVLIVEQAPLCHKTILFPRKLRMS